MRLEMDTPASLVRAIEVAAVIIVGILFFFLIIGVLGLRGATAGLLVFIFGAILTARKAPGSGARNET